MTESQTAIASRQWSKYETFYVTDLPGHNGIKPAIGMERNADWGYSNQRNHALRLTSYWQRRFMADMRRVNANGAKLEHY